MDNYINNINYQKQIVEHNLSTNLLHSLNNSEQQNSYDTESNAMLFQYQEDILKIEYAQSQFNITKFEFRLNYEKYEIGQIQLFSNNKEIKQNQFQQEDFKFKFKNRTLIIGIMENDLIYDVYLGNCTFPNISLYRLTETQQSSKISFVQKSTRIEYQQIEIHPSIQNMLITLSMQSTGQQFSIYQLQDSSILNLFSLKSENIILCEAINFNIDYFNHSNIYFTNIFGHLFQINFTEILESKQRQDSAIINQQYLYKKLHIFHYKNLQFQVYTQTINEKKGGDCIYFQKLPTNEDIFLFFFQTQEVIELVLIRFNLSKTITLFNKQITAIQELDEKLQKCKEKSQISDLDVYTLQHQKSLQRQLIVPIQKYLQNQIEIDYLYFYCKQILIQIKITEEISVRTMSFDDKDVDLDSVVFSINQAIPLDFCYFHFLILKINIEDYSKSDFSNKQSQYILFKYQTLEEPLLYERTMENRYQYDTYKKNKRIVQYLREMIEKYKQEIAQIKSVEKLNAIEGEIYTQVSKELLPIEEVLGGKRVIGSKKKTNELIFQIYQNNNEIIRILNKFDFQANVRKFELSQIKITLLFDQYQIQQNQYKKIKEQNEQRKNRDEANLRKQIINKILSLQYQQNQDSFN
ncbi:unnamed protein product (macronuclear) [Paramecium tetraurelia]|uniref:Uncharacterized protein n=1 Tax=Paramecium tetraurelia TaxID=5888 RepID=A0DQV2_PARTE|nr:uncharacterized protein GSPATT00002819001 [Paramecium tetraurelia]CAK85419.1 unnamed protein product [Paramecium tetraurelia]|eukprot:XP_001452816.1 hypothetical protein (macronuclear) [Paramecium tetraurelia strain d4-2]